AMVVQITGIPAETVHVDPALHRERFLPLLAGRKLEGQGNRQKLGATFRFEAVSSGRELQLEASGSDEVLLHSLLVRDGTRGRFEITLLVSQVESARKGSTRAGIA